MKWKYLHLYPCNQNNVTVGINQCIVESMIGAHRFVVSCFIVC